MREWIKTLLGLVVSLFIILGMPAETFSQTPRYDLLLKGGHVIDPANHIDAAMDVAVTAGKIAAVEKGIPASQADHVVAVSHLYVTPGLIDIHFHIGHCGAPLNSFTPQAPAPV